MNDQSWQKVSSHVAHKVRARVLDYTIRNNEGYLSQACSAAEILATLYTRVMRLGPSQAPPVPLPFHGVPGAHHSHPIQGGLYNGPRAPHLDRFFFSPVHYALVLYATLIETGRMLPEGLERFNQDGGTVELIGAEHSPGIEVTAGSLGQALSQAGGVALARKLRAETGRVWVFMSDGELQEGQTWEAFAALSHHGLDNIGIYFDINGQQCDGAMEGVMKVEPIRARLEAFGANVHEVDAHDVGALALAAVDPPTNGRPLVVLAYSDPCRGIDLLRGRAPKLHYVRFKNADEREAYRDCLEQMLAETEVA